VTGVCGRARVFRDSRISSSNSVLTSTIMSSNPHAQQPLQSGDDAFRGAPMQVEDPVDNYENPSTPTPPSTMFSNSNPHAQQPLQSGDDVFGGAPMQVEDLADNYENPSTPTPSSRMFSNSNPHAQQPLQLGDDVFGGAPMQVEDPADNNENPSTPTRPPPPSTMSSAARSCAWSRLRARAQSRLVHSRSHRRLLFSSGPWTL
jgi:hypothetical protein